MKLSDKIIALRKSNGMTQEELAEICNVSRQSISRWEVDISLPEIEKLLILSKIFKISLDVLLKDELSLNEVKEINSCGHNAIERKRNEVYEGVLVKESIDDESIIDLMNIHKIELWNTGGVPKYWTMLFFTSSVRDFPDKISKVMITDPNKGGNWFVDFKSGNEKYIVFRNKVFMYHIGNDEEKELVYAECRRMGILDDEMNWQE